MLVSDLIAGSLVLHYMRHLGEIPSLSDTEQII